MTDGIPALNDLSAIERQLVEHARGGIPLVCGTVPTDELFTTADPAHRIRAKLIRELLLGRHGPLDPRGVSVRGARIVGHLHLEQLATATRLTLVDCAIPETVFALQAKLGGLVLNGSRL